MSTDISITIQKAKNSFKLMPKENFLSSGEANLFAVSVIVSAHLLRIRNQRHVPFSFYLWGQ
jgi:hypothetical protein